MPLKKILAALGQNGNGSILDLVADNRKPKAKILAGIDELKNKILAAQVYIDTSDEIHGYQDLDEEVKAKILAKILAPSGPGADDLVFIDRIHIDEYDNLAPESKAKILAKILADVVDNTNMIVGMNLPDSYEEDLRGSLRTENEKLRRMLGNLYVENFTLKKKIGII